MSTWDEVAWIAPWQAIAAGDAAAWEAELARETRRGHPLHRRTVRALARRVDCDDVLFALEGGDAAAAVVHLTWRAERDPAFPWTQLHPRVADWIEQMGRDAREYEDGS